MKYSNSKKIFLHSTFRECENLLYHLSQIKTFFLVNKYTVVNKMKDADVIFLAGCIVAHQTENRFFAIYNAVKQWFPEKIIIPTGCVVNYKKLNGIGIKELKNLNTKFECKLPIDKINTSILDPILSKNSTIFHQNRDYYVQIAQGCANNCSYCSVKQAKGFVQSIPIKEITNRISELKTKKSATRFILLSDDCGSYGLDKRINISSLLNELLNFKQTFYSLNYFEPGRLKQFFELINPNFWKKVFFINIPIQAISQRLLKLLNRKYIISEIEAIIKEIKGINPHTIIATHIMYAIPTETDQEFDVLLEYNYPFDKMILFPFSSRPNTKMGQLLQFSDVEIGEKTKRVRKLSTENPKIGVAGDSLAVRFYHK